MLIFLIFPRSIEKIDVEILIGAGRLINTSV